MGHCVAGFWSCPLILSYTGVFVCLSVCLLILRNTAPLPALFRSIVISKITTVFHLVGIKFLEKLMVKEHQSREVIFFPIKGSWAILSYLG